MILVRRRASYIVPTGFFSDIKGVLLLHSSPVRFQLNSGRIKRCEFGGTQGWISRAGVGNILRWIRSHFCAV
jgi:hypothetical protein